MTIEETPTDAEAQKNETENAEEKAPEEQKEEEKK